jgi:hypothetical protein
VYRMIIGPNIHEATANSSRIRLKQPIEVLFRFSKTWDIESILHENAEQGCLSIRTQGAGGDLCDGGMAGVMMQPVTR